MVVAGLGSRRLAPLFPALLRKYPGDVLWATMVFLVCGFLFPRLSRIKIGLLASAISLCVECAKLVHAPCLDAVRPTAWYRLLFGTSFSFANLGCYLAGILLAGLVERYWQRKIAHAA